jgi:hypothetical protein
MLRAAIPETVSNYAGRILRAGLGPSSKAAIPESASTVGVAGGPATGLPKIPAELQQIYNQASPEIQAGIRQANPGMFAPSAGSAVAPAGAARVGGQPVAPVAQPVSSASYVPDPELAAMQARRAALAAQVGGQPVAQPAPAEIPMTRVHGPGEQIQNIPPIGPRKPTIRVVNPPQIPASGTADVLRQDPTLRAALAAAEHARMIHRRGFAEGGRVGQPSAQPAPLPTPPSLSLIQKILALVASPPDRQTQLGSYAGGGKVQPTAQQIQDELDYQDAIRQSKGLLATAPAPAQPAQPVPADDDVTKQIYRQGQQPGRGGYLRRAHGGIISSADAHPLTHIERILQSIRTQGR